MWVFNNNCTIISTHCWQFLIVILVAIIKYHQLYTTLTPILQFLKATMPPILKPNPRKALQRSWCPAETHHNIFRRNSGPKDRECPLLLEVLIWKAATTLIVVVWIAHIVPGRNKRGISWLAQVRCGLTFRFPPLDWLLPCSDRLGFFAMHKPARWGHSRPSSHYLCFNIADWAFPCRFDHCGWHGMRNSDSMPAWRGHFYPLSYHLCSDIVFHGQETSPLLVSYPSSYHLCFNIADLNTVAGIAWGTGIQLQLKAEMLCQAFTHLGSTPFGTRMCTYCTPAIALLLLIIVTLSIADARPPIALKANNDLPTCHQVCVI